jgi:cell division transport system ATP-binding protein
VIRFLNVTHKHPTGKGIEDVSFSLERGEFVLLAGPTGAGKTTILRLIYLELFPHSGQVMIEGQFLRSTSGYDLALMRRKMGLVFPESHLLHDRTVFENVALPLRIAGETRRRTHLQVSRLLYRFGLNHRSQSRPAELSSGEQKKTAIARALVNRPFILLADEPLANIDADSGVEILEHLRQINSEGTTILAVTHQPELYQGLARRTLQLAEGKLLIQPGGSSL